MAIPRRKISVINNLIEPPKEKEPSLHKQLVFKAAVWLKKICPLVVTELVTYAGEIPDALGFRSDKTILIECKASRADFLSDAKKTWRKFPKRFLGHYRYYFCPHGLIQPEEVPDEWGLLWLKENKVYKKKEPTFIAGKETQAELSLLLSIIFRTAQNNPHGVNVKYYEHQTGHSHHISIDAALGLLEEIEILNKENENETDSASFDCTDELHQGNNKAVQL